MEPIKTSVKKLTILLIRESGSLKQDTLFIGNCEGTDRMIEPSKKFNSYFTGRNYML